RDARTFSRRGKAPLLEADFERMDEMIALNVTALTRLTYAAAPAFAVRGGGHDHQRRVGGRPLARRTHDLVNALVLGSGLRGERGSHAAFALGKPRPFSLGLERVGWTAPTG